jgi:hypothetical protein
MQKEKRFSSIIQNLILIAIIIVSSLISNLTSFNEYTPFYEMTIIFFASIACLRAMNLLWLLVYGILRDVLFGYTIGFSAVFFLSFKILIDFQIDHAQRYSIWAIWLRFASCLALALLFQAIVMSLGFGYEFIKLLLAFAKRWYFTTLVYPVFHVVYSFITKFIDKNYHHVAEQS